MRPNRCTRRGQFLAGLLTLAVAVALGLAPRGAGGQDVDPLRRALRAADELGLYRAGRYQDGEVVRKVVFCRMPISLGDAESLPIGAPESRRWAGRVCVLHDRARGVQTCFPPARAAWNGLLFHGDPGLIESLLSRLGP